MACHREESKLGSPCLANVTSREPCDIDRTETRVIGRDSWPSKRWRQNEIAIREPSLDAAKKPSPGVKRVLEIDRAQ